MSGDGHLCWSTCLVPGGKVHVLGVTIPRISLVGLQMD